MQLTYTQNLEDWHLWKALGEASTGFYIDVGAGHPIADNVSFWFYERGWRGICAEPQPDLAALYAHIRPRDTVFEGLIGRASGETDFHIVDRLHGFSTTVETHAKGAQQFGAGYRTVRKQIVTLAELCERHFSGASPAGQPDARFAGASPAGQPDARFAGASPAGQPDARFAGASPAGQPDAREIDFLKIDVEGAEADVLMGNDWKRFRPKIVVAEAILPGSGAPAWNEWEPYLLAQGYEFTLFDTLNRFYVAKEQTEVLARAPRERADWDVVPHLYQVGRAPIDSKHPEHALAGELARGLWASLPAMDHGTLARLLARARGITDPREIEALAASMDADAFRARLGRIACGYDGGQIFDD